MKKRTPMPSQTRHASLLEAGERRRERTKSTILRASNTIIVREGHLALSAAALADFPGVSIGSVYNNFPGGLNQLAAHYIDYRAMFIFRRNFGEQIGDEVMSAVADSLIRVETEQPGILARVASVALVGASQQDIMPGLASVLSETITDGQDAGQYREDIPQAQLIEGYIGAVISPVADLTDREAARQRALMAVSGFYPPSTS
jgi:AcrR family transcriptional regulator